ncbi:MAG: hypothetical protein LBE18_13125 [Planctomycetaceae bacterium]|nr:hypothetical protein [Planctomycetaceae bacterium]
MKSKIVLSVLTLAIVFAVSCTVEAGMFGRLSHFRSCAPCGEAQVCEPCNTAVALPCEPICEPCQPCGDCRPIRPFRPISRFVNAIRERIVLHRHQLHDCDPCGEVVCEPCEVVAVEPCEPLCDDSCVRPGFFSRLRSRLAKLRPACYDCNPCEPACEPCQPVCEPCQPICEPCPPATPCIPCVPQK